MKILEASFSIKLFFLFLGSLLISGNVINYIVPKRIQKVRNELFLWLVESIIRLVAGKDTCTDSNAFYTEQLANQSLSSPQLLGITRLTTEANLNPDFEAVKVAAAEWRREEYHGV
jgi:hypothetical protein